MEIIATIIMYVIAIMCLFTVAGAFFVFFDEPPETVMDFLNAFMSLIICTVILYIVTSDAIRMTLNLIG